MSSTKPNDDSPATVDPTRKNQDAPWWKQDISSALRPENRKMLEEYTHVAPDELADHMSQAREQLWDIAPWPSVGDLTWATPYIRLHGAHAQILSKVQSGACILDCGCMISTDLRQLAYEQAPTENMYGFDVKGEFFPIGYDFFRDKDTFHGTFLAADALEDFSTTALGALRGKMDILWCPKFLHIFNREAQIAMAARLLELLKPRAGSMFVGSQNGYPGGVDVPLAPGSFKGQGTTFFLADEETLREMWAEVAQRTGTKWDLDVRLLDLRTVGLHVDDGSEYKKWVGWNLQWTATLVEPMKEV